jgi:hypothetical protein
MTNTYRTGIATVTFAVNRICEIVRKFGPSLSAAIAAAVTAGHITSEQATAMNAFLVAAQATCDLWKKASGY